jgi:hypothetical protein
MGMEKGLSFVEPGENGGRKDFGLLTGIKVESLLSVYAGEKRMTPDPQVIRMNEFIHDNVTRILRSQSFQCFCCIVLFLGVSLHDISPLAISYDAVSLHHPPREGWKP